MDITIEAVSDTRKRGIFTFSSEELSAMERSSLDALGKHFWRDIKGFRKGKAPKELIKQRFPKEFQEQMEGTAFKKALEALKLRTDFHFFDSVDSKFQNLALGSPGVITFDVFPKVTIPDYKSLTFEMPSLEVSEHEEQQALERLLRQHSTFEQVLRPAKASDYVKCSYTSTFEGQPAQSVFQVAPLYTHQSNTWEEVYLEEPVGVPGLMEALEGMQAEEVKTFTYTFADSFEEEALRGKALTYTVKVHEIRERKSPSLDAAFLKKIGVASLEALKAQIREDLMGIKYRDGKMERAAEVIRFLTTAPDFPLPQLAVERTLQETFERTIHKRMREGEDKETLEAQKETLYKDSHRRACEELKVQLLLNAIAKAEGIQVTQQDLEDAFKREVSRSRIPPQELLKMLTKTPGAMQELKGDTLINKTLDFLANPAIVEA